MQKLAFRFCAQGSGELWRAVACTMQQPTPVMHLGPISQAIQIRNFAPACSRRSQVRVILVGSKDALRCTPSYFQIEFNLVKGLACLQISWTNSSSTVYMYIHIYRQTYDAVPKTNTARPSAVTVTPEQQST